MKRCAPKMLHSRTAAGMLFLLMALPLSSQTETSKADDRYAFDVVSIRQSSSHDYMAWQETQNTWRSTNATAMQLIYFAYHIGVGRGPLVAADQLTGLPPWAESTGYDLAAKILDERVSSALQSLPPEQRSDVYAKMLQPVLESRFHLRIHSTTVKRHVYELRVSPGGIRFLTSATPTPRNSISVGNERIIVKGRRLNDLVANLSSITGRIVLDKTKLTGNYDYTLRWKQDDDTDPNNTSPSIYSAVKDQLGLELLPAVADVDVLVVDHLERPTDN